MKSFSLLLLGVGISSCSGSSPAPGTYAPIDRAHAVFWDRQTTESAKLLNEIADAFNAQHPALPIKVEKAGGYGDIFRKVSASIQARKLPAMAVSYESMTAEYLPSGAIAPLDDFLNDPEIGFSQAELDDFFPVALESSRYTGFDGKVYSFPFAKSVLMLYYNNRVLAAAGIEAPPKTWLEFLDQCRQIKATTGKFAHGVHVDASTVSAIIYSMGGVIIEDGKTQYDQAAALEAFGIYETLAKEKLAYQIAPGTFDDEVALAGDQIAFTLRSSGGRLNVNLAMDSDPARWGMTHIPQANPEKPITVLFGPSVNIFNTSAEQQRTAWAFVRYFTSPGVSARWARETGYLPVRKSSLEDPALKEFLAQDASNRAAFDALPTARPEPNVLGWQQIRPLVERAQTEVLTGLSDARTAALKLKQQADAVLAKQ